MEKLFGADNVLVRIFESLMLNDQLALAQVNSSLRRIFESFIFPAKYPKLKMVFYTKVLVSNDNNEDCMLLKNNEAEEFLNFSADTVEELHLHSMFINFRICSNSCIVARRKLRNLTCLHFEELLLSEKHLLLVAVNCPMLSELRLISCNNEENKEPLMIGQGVSVSVLEQIKKLKILVLFKMKSRCNMSSFFDLISKVPLECLKLDAFLVQDVHDDLNEKSFHQHLKELQISLNCKSLEMLECTGILKNLLKLNLTISDDVTYSALHMIANECENLESLTFNGSSFYQITTDFILPPSLKELSISNNCSLRHEHLKDALTKFKIEKLSCKDLDVRWYPKDFRLSPYIQVLDMVYRDSLAFPSFYSNNNSLKEVHWYAESWDSRRNTPNAECLKTCRNLENLFIHSGYVSLDVILELSHLHKVTFCNRVAEFNWPYLIGLLKHPSLKELDIMFLDFKDVANFPVQGFTSTVTLVNLFYGYTKCWEFWLIMLKQNPEMTINFNYFFMNDNGRFERSLLYDIIYHKNFPKDLHEIKLWGFNIKCRDLIDNTKGWAIIQILKQSRQYICSQNICLILSRKKN